MQAAYRVPWYIKRTLEKGLYYSSSSLPELSVADADWVACPDTRRSVSGFCVFLGNSLISWKSTKQHTVSRSSAEAQYRAMTQATCEAVWIDSLLKHFGVVRRKAVPLFCDNKSINKSALNLKKMSKTTTTAVFFAALIFCSAICSAARLRPLTLHGKAVAAQQIKAVGIEVEESCDGIGEQECLRRRTNAAHLDYIYTQHHNP